MASEPMPGGIQSRPGRHDLYEPQVDIYIFKAKTGSEPPDYLINFTATNI